MRIFARPARQGLATVSALVLAALATGVAQAAGPSAGPATASHVLRTRALAAAAIPGPLIDHGGFAQEYPQVYVDFWGWTSDPSGERPYLTAFLSSVGGTRWLDTVNEYGAAWAGASSGLLVGTWSDGAAVPSGPDDAQIRQEAAAAADHFRLGLADPSSNVEIVVATPTGHSTPGFGSSFCAYHGVLQDRQLMTYTNLPYMTDAGAACGQGSVNGSSGTLDGVSIVEGEELAESITDPLWNAWSDASGHEIGSKCAWTSLANISTSAGTFAVQPLWSNAANGCVLAMGDSYEVAFQASTANLWTTGSYGSRDWGLGMMRGTSPSIAALRDGGYEMALQANTGSLWVAGAAGTRDLGLGMMGGTSPSIAALAGGGYEVAFQADTGSLWVAGSAGTGDQGLPMMPGSSPSITPLPRSDYEVAFQANTANLWATGSEGMNNWGPGMMPGASPSITGLLPHGYEVAFQASTTNLRTAGSNGTGDWGLGMMPGTSPSIAALIGRRYEMAFQANTGSLWVAGSAAYGDVGLPMMPGTSPSIATSRW